MSRRFRLINGFYDARSRKAVTICNVKDERNAPVPELIIRRASSSNLRPSFSDYFRNIRNWV